MNTPRPLVRTILVAVSTAALMGSAGLASARPGSLPHTGNPHGGTHGNPHSTEGHCKAERADVQAAKKDVAHARHTGGPAKVHAAEEQLAKQRTQASRWCSAAKSEAAATARAAAALAGWSALATDTALTSLPAGLHDVLVADAASAQAQVETLSPQIAGASSRQLAHLVDQLRSLDPSRLQAALSDLDTALSTYQGDPTDLLSGVTDALAAFDAAGRPTHLQALVGAVEAATEAVAAAGEPVPAP